MCGVIGIYGHPKAAELLLLALAMLEHRGQSATGMAGYTNLDPLTIRVIKNHGSVDRALSLGEFEKEEIIFGGSVIGHTRWPTQGDSSRRNIQPHYAQTSAGKIALANNGDIVNMDSQRDFLRQNKIRVYSENDAEIIAASIVYQMFIRPERKNVIEAIFQVMDHIMGAYAAVMMTEFDQKMYAFCDPLGIRPLLISKIKKGGNFFFVISSESCVAEGLTKYDEDAYIIEEHWLEPGEVAVIDNDKFEIHLYPNRCQRKFCIFEYIYFSRPDSHDWRGISFYSLRKKMGAQLAEEQPLAIEDKSDVIVVPVPESGVPAALGYAEAAGLPLQFGILAERSFGKKRTFIELDPRGLSKIKYRIIPDVVRDKIVVVIDDSIVRGNASTHIIAELFKAGAKEVHLRIPSPPYRYSCDKGVETRDPQTLIAARAEGDIEKIRRNLGSEWGTPNSLGYLSREGVAKAIGTPLNQFCHQCFSGQHPLRTG